MFDELYSAIDDNNIEDFIKELAYACNDSDCNFDINTRDNYGNTLLHHAAMFSRDNVEIVKCLLGCGADIDAINDEGNTPLHNAIVEGNNESVAIFLIQHGANIYFRDNSNTTLLHWAVNFDLVDVVCLLLSLWFERDGNVNDINIRDNYGNTPLFVATCKADYSIVKRLLDYGADVNVCNNNGHTPLHAAAAYHRPDIIKLLLNEGADITACDTNGLDALHFASHPMYDMVPCYDVPKAIESTTVLLNHVMNNDDVDARKLSIDVVNYIW